MAVSMVSMPRFVATCFLATGVPFGLFMALDRASPLRGVVAGALFGAAMTFMVGGLHIVKAWRGGGVADVHQTDQFLVTGDVGRAKEAAERALCKLGVARTREEQGEGTFALEGRTRMSWKSWGEIVRVEVGPVADGTVPVNVSSRPSWRTTLADHGKNLANVRAFRAAMGA
jgi:hypothetical protein